MCYAYRVAKIDLTDEVKDCSDIKERA
jgi:hypothetical protein